MNLPNKLTVLRVIMISVFRYFPALAREERQNLPPDCLALFIIASLTDLLDGKIARSIIW